MNQESFALLSLSFVEGVGPVLARRLIAAFGDASSVFRADERSLTTVEGVGAARARSIVSSRDRARRQAEDEIVLAQQHATRIYTLADNDYPALLREFDDSPTVLFVKGTLGAPSDRFCVAIVGSRDCSAYGIEQSERFAGVLGRAGLSVVSGGARGIDAAAHHACLRAGGRTIAVLGCGLAKCYPPEHRDLFEKIVHAGGALVSELPMNTPPSAENFPARNRIISGLSLGVVVIEAGLKSGALITARVAAEDHGREVFAVPGRVDSPHSRGTHELLKEGGAHFTTDPADVIAALEAPAHHVHSGTHGHRYATATIELPAGVNPDPLARSILDALNEPMSPDHLIQSTGADAPKVLAQLTLLEIQGRITREGPRFKRVR